MIKATEGIVFDIVVFDSGLLKINHAYNKGEKGSFRKFFEDTLLPYCRKNNITTIELDDSCSASKDVWSNYGFSGAYLSAGRFMHIEQYNNKSMNNLVRMISSEEKYMDEDIEFQADKISDIISFKQIVLDIYKAKDISKKEISHFGNYYK